MFYIIISGIRYANIYKIKGNKSISMFVIMIIKRCKK